MKLFASITSPFARLVRAVIDEKGLKAHLEMVWVNPWESPAALAAVNPLCRVPTLVTDDGTALTESLLILTFLESRYPEPKLVPRGQQETVMHKVGLAHGLIDAAVDIVSSRRHRENADADPIVQRRFDLIRAALPAVTGALDGRQRVDLGDLVLAVALDYLDFRLPEINWRASSAEAVQRCDAILALPSLARTSPSVE